MKYEKNLERDLVCLPYHFMGEEGAKVGRPLRTSGPPIKTWTYVNVDLLHNSNRMVTLFECHGRDVGRDAWLSKWAFSFNITDIFSISFNYEERFV